MNDFEKKKRDLLGKSYTTRREDEPYTISFDELLHGAPQPVGQPYRGMRCFWNPWKALSDPTLLEILVDLARHTIDSAQWEWLGFDIICSMSATSSPVASVLSLRYQKPLFYSDNRTYGFLPEEPSEGDRVLLIDSLVSSGFHLFRILKFFWPDEFIIEGYKHVNVFSFAFDDLGGTGDRLRFVNAWRRNGKLKYIYELSELVAVWRTELDQKFGH
jgi:hypothetical protein